MNSCWAVLLVFWHVICLKGKFEFFCGCTIEFIKKLVLGFFFFHFFEICWSVLILLIFIYLFFGRSVNFMVLYCTTINCMFFFFFFGSTQRTQGRGEGGHWPLWESNRRPHSMHCCRGSDITTLLIVWLCVGISDCIFLGFGLFVVGHLPSYFGGLTLETCLQTEQNKKKKKKLYPKQITNNIIGPHIVWFWRSNSYA